MSDNIKLEWVRLSYSLRISALFRSESSRMSTTRSKQVIPSTFAGNCFEFCAFGIILVVFLLMIVVPTYLDHYQDQKKQTENLQIFNSHFAPLPEVQELYNLSAINSTWFDLKPLSFTNWDRIGSDSLPESFEELTMNLLLESMKKQNTLESEVKTLERQMESQGKFLNLVLVINVALVVLVGVLWKRTSGISK